MPGQVGPTEKGEYMRNERTKNKLCYYFFFLSRSSIGLGMIFSRFFVCLFSSSCRFFLTHARQVLDIFSYRITRTVYCPVMSSI